MPNLLVLCHANQFRSVVTEYALRDRFDPSTWTVASAGLWAEAGRPAAHGLIDWSGLPEIVNHRSRPVSAQLLSSADLVLVMERSQKEALALEFPDSADRIYLLSELSARIPYDLPDPALGGENPKNLVREIISLVEKGQPRLVELARQNAHSS
jgi:protein-tyrosine phosphatase